MADENPIILGRPRSEWMNLMNDIFNEDPKTRQNAYVIFRHGFHAGLKVFGAFPETLAHCLSTESVRNLRDVLLCIDAYMDSNLTFLLEKHDNFYPIFKVILIKYHGHSDNCRRTLLLDKIFVKMLVTFPRQYMLILAIKFLSEPPEPVTSTYQGLYVALSAAKVTGEIVPLITQFTPLSVLRKAVLNLLDTISAYTIHSKLEVYQWAEDFLVALWYLNRTEMVEICNTLDTSEQKEVALIVKNYGNNQYGNISEETECTKNIFDSMYISEDEDEDVKSNCVECCSSTGATCHQLPSSLDLSSIDIAEDDDEEEEKKSIFTKCFSLPNTQSSKNVLQKKYNKIQVVCVTCEQEIITCRKSILDLLKEPHVVEQTSRDLFFVQMSSSSAVHSQFSWEEEKRPEELVFTNSPSTSSIESYKSLSRLQKSISTIAEENEEYKANVCSEGDSASITSNSQILVEENDKEITQEESVGVNVQSTPNDEFWAGSKEPFSVNEITSCETQIVGDGTIPPSHTEVERCGSVDSSDTQSVRRGIIRSSHAPVLSLDSIAPSYIQPIEDDIVVPPLVLEESEEKKENKTVWERSDTIVSKGSNEEYVVEKQERSAEDFKLETDVHGEGIDVFEGSICTEINSEESLDEELLSKFDYIPDKSKSNMIAIEAIVHQENLETSKTHSKEKGVVQKKEKISEDMKCDPDFEELIVVDDKSIKTDNSEGINLEDISFAVEAGNKPSDQKKGTSKTKKDHGVKTLHETEKVRRRRNIPRHDTKTEKTNRTGRKQRVKYDDKLNDTESSKPSTSTSGTNSRFQSFLGIPSKISEIFKGSGSGSTIKSSLIEGGVDPNSVVANKIKKYNLAYESVNDELCRVNAEISLISATNDRIDYEIKQWNKRLLLNNQKLHEERKKLRERQNE